MDRNHTFHKISLLKFILNFVENYARKMRSNPKHTIVNPLAIDNFVTSPCAPHTHREEPTSNRLGIHELNPSSFSLQTEGHEKHKENKVHKTPHFRAARAMTIESFFRAMRRRCTEGSGDLKNEGIVPWYKYSRQICPSSFFRSRYLLPSLRVTMVSVCRNLISCNSLSTSIFACSLEHGKLGCGGGGGGGGGGTHF